MFAHFGSERTDRHNRILAAYLACVGGFVNAVGLLLIGSPTSHVTGNVARFAADFARGDLRAGLSATLMVASFFVGATAAAMLTEASVFRRTPFAYGAALGCEAALLGAFGIVANAAMSAHPRVQDAAALFLCVAMGMQNSLVTRISGAVVRTTHLTGVITDLGIESARWFRWYRSEWGKRLHVPMVVRGEDGITRPEPVRFALLATIAFAFAIGAFAGARLAFRIHERAMLVPTVAVALGSVYAIWSGRRMHVAIATLEASAPRESLPR